MIDTFFINFMRECLTMTLAAIVRLAEAEARMKAHDGQYASARIRNRQLSRNHAQRKKRNLRSKRLSQVGKFLSMVQLIAMRNSD